MRRRSLPIWTPSEEQMGLWPAVSGNALNGVGETSPRRPSPIYWHPPDSIPHGPLQRWFYARPWGQEAEVVEARRDRQEAIDAPLAPIAQPRNEHPADKWTAKVKRFALDLGADAVGITPMRAQYVFEDAEVPPFRWMIVIALGQTYAPLASAPSVAALAEITRTYAQGTRVAKSLASWIRTNGHDALPYGGPMAGSFVLIPAAIAAGLGELGKHGSLIHPELGANFRLACVLTDLPLEEHHPSVFGADDFCTSCRICEDACPPAAILPDKQIVRGEVRWSVDFDRCLPYFNENMSCALCVAVCPFSRPGIGGRLVEKLAKKRARNERGDG